MKKTDIPKVAANFAIDPNGATSIEYALIGSLIAVAVVVTVKFLGQSVLTLWIKVSNCIIFATNNGSGTCL